LGEAGATRLFKVPRGVAVQTDEGVQLGDLLQDGDSLTVATGGEGGTEATNFLGVGGQRRSVRLDLKLIGDVGFVGFPNAGKSTLLKALSRARPKIASYPFTTIKPNLGVCEFEDLRKISFADLPGLIEGAHMNEGMGHSFLKHVERTRVLMFVVDINGFQFKADSAIRSALETILILNRELELYKADLLDKPAICVLTKMDAKGADASFEQLSTHLRDLKQAAASLDPLVTPPERFINFSEVVPVSAKFSPKTVEYLKFRVRNVMDDLAHAESEALLEELEDQVDRKLAEKTNIL